MNFEGQYFNNNRAQRNNTGYSNYTAEIETPFSDHQSPHSKFVTVR